jgi:hypothetical protein
MKKFLVTLFALPLLTLAAPVHADDDEPPSVDERMIANCIGPVQKRADNWSNTVVYVGPLIQRPWQASPHETRLTATVVYWYCPNGGNQWLVKPIFTDFCYTHIDPVHASANFNGVKFNPYYFDENEGSNPPDVDVPDAGQQECKKQSIALENRKWLEATDHPHWKVTAWIKLFSFPDHEHVFKWNDFDLKPLQPLNDPALGPWID